MNLKTKTCYGLTITQEDKLNYFKAMSPNPEFIYLHDPVKFDERFLEKTRECDTYEEAYQAVEEEHKSTFGSTKYSNYRSYYYARSRRIKERQSA